jgi:exonuclease III
MAEGRILTMELPSLFIVAVYVPNSGAKLQVRSVAIL